MNEYQKTGVIVGGNDVDSNSRDNDEIVLAAMGKKQVLRRNFNILSMLGLTLSSTSTWEGILIVFVYGLTDGGPAGLVCGYIFCWLGYHVIVASMAELASMAPTAGGQYHWVYLFGPANSKVFLSYLTGWQQVIAWQAVVASGTYLSGNVVQGLAILNYPDYAAKVKKWQGTLLIYAVILIACGFNSFLGRFLPQVEWVALTIHLGAFVGIMVSLIYFAPHGADAPVHLSEEIHRATTTVPWIMLSAVVINGILGFGMLITVLFCIGTIDDALKTPTGYPYIEIFAQAVGNVRGATVMAAFITTMIFSGTISVFAPASRITWAFARDRGLPGSRWLSHVHPTMKLPFWSMALTTLATLLLGLVNIGSTLAFNAIISLTVAGFLGSYILPVGLLVWMKLTRPHEIRYGPWKMGRWGIAVNIFGMAWTIIAMIFSFFPVVVTDLTAKSMNWSCVLFGGTMIFAFAFYFVYGKRHYTGPVIEISVTELLA